MKDRLGCLSNSGLLAATLTLLLLVGAAVSRGGVMFSPGKLNAQTGAQPLGGVRSHAEIGGDCAACHAPPWGRQTMDDRCLVCHQEVASQLRSSQTLHGTLLRQENTFACRDCHSEHNGPDAPLTTLDADRFPHQATGYSLQGHQQMWDGTPFNCAHCHTETISSFDLTTCENCHRDLDPLFTQTHISTFGQSCLDCHDGVDTYGRDFDHNQLPFPLSGRHAALNCADCHQGARSPADLQAAPGDCVSCHADRDPHKGKFGQNCAVCHTPDDWEQASFDHALTAFPLSGRHSDLECEQCHLEEQFAGTPTDCFACHAQNDAHQGQFGQDCAQCHTPESWETASFDHSLAAFPLTGAHTRVECTACHLNNVFKGTPKDCAACHAEPAFHAGLFPTNCDSCHTTDAWSPATFTQSHTFPINHGERGASACSVCHPDSLTTYTCYTCHEHDPAKVERKHLKEGITDFQNCVKCHPTGREEEGEREDD